MIWIKRHPVMAFYLLTFFISWACWLPLIFLVPSSSVMSLNFLLQQIGIFAPLLSALLLTGMMEGRTGRHALLVGLLRWRVGVQWYLFVLFFDTVLVLGLLGLALLLKWSSLHPFGIALLYLVPLDFLLSLLLDGPMGEELGWRGYALPRLQQRHSALVAALIVGLLWGIWHFPLFWVSGSAQNLLLPGNPLLAFAGFTTHNAFLSIIYTWVFNHTGGSVLMTMLLHAAGNTAIFLLVSLVGDMAAGLVPIVLHAGAIVLFALFLVVVSGPTYLAGEQRARRGGA